VDYSDLTGQVHEDMPAEEFVAMASSPKMFGNPLLRTQHLLGGARLEVVSSNEVTARHQVRSESIQLSEEDSKSVVDISSRRVVVTMTYVKINGQWRISGMKPKALS
jgi:scytalone dehydratase